MGAKFKTNNGKLPIQIQGTNFAKPINYKENRGSAQCKSSVMLAALTQTAKQLLKQKNPEIILSFCTNI